MKRFLSLDGLALKNTAIAIGVFDGVHRGHLEVLRQARAAARELPDGFALAMTFDRHPAELLAPRFAPLALSSLSQRMEWFETLGHLDGALAVPFTFAFANLTAQQFVDHVLVERLGARRIFVGADFRYGKDRHGSVMDLEAAGETHGFDVSVVHSIGQGGERVSSTRIRALVADGDIGTANTLLGHPFALRGTVVHGKKLGRTIGFPTANLAVEESRQLLPANGVYAAFARLHRAPNEAIAAAVSVGTNPTTDGEDTTRKVEAYLMDGFDSDIYGQPLDLEFLGHIRPEHKFETLDDLVEQMQTDVAVAARLCVVRREISG